MEGYYAKALFPYSAVEATELTVNQGDVVFVEEQNDSGWCLAKKHESGVSGWLPTDYVERCEPPVGPAPIVLSQPVVLQPEPEAYPPPVEEVAAAVESLSVASRSSGAARPAAASVAPVSGGDGKTCGKCGLAISGAFVVAKDKTYHADCFRCSTCSTALGGKAFIEKDNDIFCEACYYTAFNPKCAHCDEVIKGQYISALGKSWHPDHFVCTECAKPFEGNQFHKHNDRPYCEKHFNELFAEACAKCGLKIEGQVFEALDKKYHLDCFTCSVGDHEIGEGVNFHVHDEKIYCPQHFEELFLQRCAGCGSIVKGQYIKVLDAHFHPGCWKCADCGTVITSDNCGQSGGKFYCKPCVGKKGGPSPAPAAASAAAAAAPRAQASRDVKASPAPAAAAAPAAEVAGDVFLTLAAIKEALNESKKPSPDARKIPAGFDPEKAELSLSEGDFQGYFKMDKATYTALPAWKRKRLREKVFG